MTITRRARTRATTTVGAAALAALLLGALVAPASAAPIGGVGLIDPAKNGESSLLITKYATHDDQSGLPATGAQSNVPGTTIEGVQFSISPVLDEDARAPLDLLDDEGWAAAADITTAWSASAPLVFAGDYVLGAAMTGTTDGVGELSFGDLDFGLYLVQELSPYAAGVTGPALPFLVTLPYPTVDLTGNTNEWLYEVFAYPKNSVVDVTKTVVGDDAAFSTQASYVAWSIVADVPLLAQGQELDEFRLVDTVDPAKLAFTTVGTPHGVAGVSEYSVQVFAAEGSTPLALDTDHYTLVANHTTGTLALTFLADGLDFLQDEALGGRVELVVPTRVLTAGSVALDNEVTLYANEAELSADASQPFGALTIFKYASTTGAVAPATALAGAEFALYHDADGDGVLDADDDEIVEIAGLTRADWTTPSDGRFTVAGIKPGDYLLVEVQAPAGYRPIDAPIAVTVAAGTTTAAAGSTTAAVNYVPVANSQYAAWELPFTGGNGVLTFTLIGAGLMALALGLALIGRRRRAERAAA
ncbi:SpaH/EbpB family LPXTG-anchored major pilin [Salinibacterium sp. ZJ70]|uniref:SpaH/EbpB family LPXTG-anchored major pilin n=1 Tax=Salinibacterium sp. ZJ70 TaxID=2708084 RepID=UPI0014210E7D|nr:SpaH/EbpB family LPXTG-anchored major pilin [Salinibacterium sp. ZJ70]